MKKEIKSLTFFPNGLVMAFDDKGGQIEEIQVMGWMEYYFDRLGKMGYDPREIPDIRARLNDGTWKWIKPFLTSEDKWSFRITEIK